MGREKITLTNELIEKAKECFTKGFTMAQVAACLGMSKRTLERRLEEDSDAKVALEASKAIADAEVTATAFQMAKSGKHPSMTQFWLRSRCGWQDSSESKPEPIEIKLAYNLKNNSP